MSVLIISEDGTAKEVVELDDDLTEEERAFRFHNGHFQQAVPNGEALLWENVDGG